MRENSLKKIIFSADDFGKCREMNIAIQKAFLSGVLTSTCIMTNGNDYDYAAKEIYPQCEGLGLGCHLNIIEGKSFLYKDSRSLLCDAFGNFNCGYGYMLLNSHNKSFLDEVEVEFRAQIEKSLNSFKIDHLNSHVHVHGIPAFFKLTCKLAKEYGIPYVRTQKELFYGVSELGKYKEMGVLDISLNFVKNILLNSFTSCNVKFLKSEKLFTNDYFIGLLFTSYMDKRVILDGLKKIPEGPSVTEVLIHPYYFEDLAKSDFRKEREYLLTQDKDIVSKIEELGFVFANFSSIA